MKGFLLTYVLLCFFITISFAQTINDGGFELSGWTVCEGTPKITNTAGHATDITGAGNFLVLTASAAGDAMQSVSTGITGAALVPNGLYYFNVDLAHPLKYNNDTQLLDGYGYLEVYGSMTSCGEDQLLWCSGPVCANTWNTYTVVFQPAQAYTFIKLKTKIISSTCTGPGKMAAIAVDNIGAMTHITATVTNATCGTPKSGYIQLSQALPDPIKPAYQIIWSNGISTNYTNLANVDPGDYTLNITNSLCSAGGGAFKYQVAGGNFTASVTKTDIACGAAANSGAATIVATGPGPYTYSWSHSAAVTTATANNLTAGTYTVIVTDNGGCSYSVVFDIKQATNNVILDVSTKTDVNCFGDATGSATVKVNPSAGNYTYLWNSVPTQATATAANLKAGTYTVTVTDASNCTKQASVTITENPVIVIGTPVIKTPTCGQSDGEADITGVVTGGVPPYTYLWNTTPAQTTAKLTGVAAGNYQVTVTDSKGCTKTQSVVINNISGPTVTISSKNVTCTGLADGTATAAVTNSTGTITYNWSTTPVQAGATVVGLGGGTYTVIVTDGSNCPITKVVIIDEAATLLSPAVTVVPSSCGIKNGSATAVITGGKAPFQYSWNTTPVQTTSAITGLSGGTYVVTVTDANGCIKTANALVDASTGMVIKTDSTQASCGKANGSASVIVSGGSDPYHYTWQGVPVPQDLPTIDQLIAGIYTVTVTDSKGCSRTVSVTVVDASAMIPDITVQPATCGQKNGTAVAKIISGGVAPYSYSWSTVPVQKNATATDLGPGTYTVTVTDSKGCTQIKAVTITGSSALKLAVATIPAACNQANGSATATVTGGTGVYIYNWNTTPPQTTAAVTNLSAGAYLLNISDDKGCKKDTLITIATTSGLAFQMTSKGITCRGDANGTITPKVAGGTAPVTLTMNGTAIISGTPVTNLGAGIYLFEATDGAGCKATSTLTFVNPEELVIGVSNTKALCGGNSGSVTASVTGGVSPYTYLWNTTPAQTTMTAGGLPAGNYAVVVTDANGCSKANNTTISSSSGMQLSANPTPTSCGLSNGKGAVNITGGDSPFTYEWSPAPIQTSAVATNLKPGTYTVKVTDANGCTQTQIVTINSSTAPQVFIDIPAKIKCAGTPTGSATATANGGTTPYTYVWNTTPAQTGPNLQNVIAGTYVVTMTDKGPCTATATVKIEEYARIKIDTSTTTSKCSTPTGSATVKASGGLPGVNGYSYKWSTNPVQSTATATNLPAGTYTVTITDDNNCTATSVITIRNVNLPVLSFSETTNVKCFGGTTGSATVAVKNGTSPFLYNWTTAPVQQTTAQATNLSAGTYTVKVTDNELCTATATVTITQPPELKVTIKDTVHVKCNGGKNGGAVAIATGGVAPYTYKWSDVLAQKKDTATGLGAGTYIVIVTDKNGCTSSATVVIRQPDSIKTSFKNVVEDLCSAKKGAATVVTTGGTAPYTYLWAITTPAQTTVTATGLSAGLYTVTVTDKNGCVKKDSVEIKATSSLKVKMDSINDVTCFGAANGSAFIKIVSGGTPGFKFIWNTLPAQTEQKATSLKPGSYTVTVTDTLGCTAKDSVKITEPKKLILKIDSVIHLICFGVPSGSAYVKASEGTKPYKYSWNTTPIQTTPKATQLLAGEYVVTVTDSNQCVDSAKVTIREGRKITVKPQKDDTICTGHTITLTAKGANGIAPYTYVWKPIGPVITPVKTDSYKVVAIDSSGCVSDTQSVRIVMRPPIYINPMQAEEICVGKSIKLTAHPIGGDGNFEYLWLPSKQTTPEITVTPSGSTLYSVIVTDGCKSKSDTTTVLVVVDPLPEITFTSDMVFGCAPIEVTFINISKNTSHFPSEIVWDFGDNKGPSTGTPNGHLFDVPGKYNISLTITDSNGRCKNTKKVDSMITVYPVPKAKFAASEHNVSVLEARICFTNFSNGGDFFVWDFGDSKDPFNSSNETNPCHTYNDTGSYCVKLKTLNDYGCYDTLVYCVYVRPDFVMYIPNAFTPSSSRGVNDYFGPQGTGFDETRFKMLIFDRSGSVIYRTDSFYKPWDGTVNGGQIAAQGVYVYQINCFDTRGNEYIKTGTVTVIR